MPSRGSEVNLPNYITLTRIFSVPVLIWILSQQPLRRGRAWRARTAGLGGVHCRLHHRRTRRLPGAPAPPDHHHGHAARPAGRQAAHRRRLRHPGAVESQRRAGVDGGGHHRARIPGQRPALHRRAAGLHHRRQRPRQGQNGGADRGGGAVHPRPPLDAVGFRPLLLPHQCAGPRRHLVHGHAVAGLGHGLLRRASGRRSTGRWCAASGAHSSSAAGESAMSPPPSDTAARTPLLQPAQYSTRRAQRCCSSWRTGPSRRAWRASS